MLNFILSIPTAHFTNNKFQNSKLNTAIMDLLFDTFVFLTWDMPYWMKGCFIFMIIVESLRLFFTAFSQDYLNMINKDYIEK